jgi:hypothetical protein
MRDVAQLQASGLPCCWFICSSIRAIPSQVIRRFDSMDCAPAGPPSSRTKTPRVFATKIDRHPRFGLKSSGSHRRAGLRWLIRSVHSIFEEESSLALLHNPFYHWRPTQYQATTDLSCSMSNWKSLGNMHRGCASNLSVYWSTIDFRLESWRAEDPPPNLVACSRSRRIQ